MVNTKLRPRLQDLHYKWQSTLLDPHSTLEHHDTRQPSNLLEQPMSAVDDPVALVADQRSRRHGPHNGRPAEESLVGIGHAHQSVG